MLLSVGSGLICLAACMAPGPRMPILFYNKCGTLPLPCWEKNHRIFKGRLRNIITLLSDIQCLAIMWAYASLPLTTVPNILLFSSFKDLLFLKYRRPSI
ncbi:hypothetical protein AMTRI_Chr12g269960 [Amborella trichopoda]